MANAEAAVAAAGPRYAPDDPTLPKPWKGLIDGSTGLTYYWNPETNITQYEKPAGEAVQLPPALPPVEMASQTTAQQRQLGDVSQYPSQYMNQSSQQHGQPGDVSQYPTQYMNQSSQQPGQFPSSVTGQVPRQQPSQIPPTGQLGSYPGQHYAHPGQGMHERGPQGGHMPMQQGQYGSQMGQQLDQHTITQQGPHLAKQPGQQISELGQQTSQHIMPQQGSHVVQQPGQPLAELGQQTGQRIMPQQGSHVGQQHGQNQASQLHSPPVGHSQSHQFLPQHMHYAPYQQSMPPHGQPNAQPQSQHMPQGPRFPYPQPQDSRNMGFDGNQQPRGGQGFPFNANSETPPMAAQHPNLAAIPMARNQQDSRIGAISHHNTHPSPDSSLNAGAAHGMHSMFNHSNVDRPMPNQAFMRPTPLISGPTDGMNMQSAEAYRLQHEVTATGENVPAPYMTFEAAGFAPEILREVRYLLQWGAYVVRCTAMRALYVQQVLLLRLHNGLWSLHPYDNSFD